MEFEATAIPDVILVKPRVFGDDRGFFLEMYQAERFRTGGIDLSFVQDNLSRSERGVLRGLHYQVQHAQGKMVTVLRGEVYDVAVDLRRRSPTFGKSVGIHLSDVNRHSLYIPPGFAHGFYVLSDAADFFYKCTDFYYPEHERTILWSDPALGIEWPLEGAPKLSAKDQQGLLFADAPVFE